MDPDDILNGALFAIRSSKQSFDITKRSIKEELIVKKGDIIDDFLLSDKLD